MNGSPEPASPPDGNQELSPGLGHMIQHLAPDAVGDAINRTALRSSRVWAL
jgi:hypothetical protein